MNKIIVFHILLYCCSCSLNNSSENILTDEEWRNILDYTTLISEIEEGKVFYRYDNIKMREVLKYAYVNRSETLGYRIKDSIVNEIISRKNKIVNNKLDTIIPNLSFVKDITDLNEDYLIYSEPFFIDTDKICLSLMHRNNEGDVVNQWVFFFKKEDENFRMIQFYDHNKDTFYGPVIR